MTIRKAFAFSFLDRYASLVLNIGSSVIVARLLTPAEIGIFSIAMVLLSFAATFRDFGAANYITQEKVLTVDKIRAAFSVQLMLGFGLAILIAALSYPMAQFYEEPKLMNVMFVIALNYALNPFGAITQAWLTRELKFDALALIHFASAFGGVVVSLAMAHMGFGAISLAWGGLAATLTSVLVSVIYRPGYFPVLPGFAGVKAVLAFGSHSTAISLINAATRGSPELFLGKLQNVTSVGIFSRANGLVSMFARLVIDAVFSVSISLFSKEYRKGNSIARQYIKATSYMAALGWSFCLFLIFLALPVIRLLYGPQWDSAANITRLIALGMMFAIPVSLGSAALMAVGAISSAVRATIISGIPVIIILGLGSYLGLIALGCAIVIGGILNCIVYYSILKRKIGFMWRDLYLALAKSGVVAMCSSVAPLVVCAIYGATSEEIALPLLFATPGAAAGFIIGIFVVRHPLVAELQGALLFLSKR